VRFVILACVAMSALISAPAALAQDPAPPVRLTVRIGAPVPVQPVPPGFVGLSMEFQSAATTMGPPSDQNGVLAQLIRDLDPGQSAVLRIGGDSTDHTWSPTPGLTSSPGLTFALTPSWLSSVGAFAGSIGAKLILGVNLEANDPELAADEAAAFTQGIGPAGIEAFEIGNEPNLYSAFPWYQAEGVLVDGRSTGYDFASYASDFSQTAAALPSLPLAGPALGSPEWMPDLPALMTAVPRLQIITYHRYPLNRCFTAPGSSQYPTLSNLLSRGASSGLAASVAPFVAMAAAAGREFRVDELNSVACSGQPGVSDTFASALWALDTLFALARRGVDGVNFHTFPTAAYRLFSFATTGGVWSATVNPEYYGLLLFAHAAPAGSELLAVHAHRTPNVRTWATQTSAGAVHVVVINEDPVRPARVFVRAPESQMGAHVELLQAPGLAATSGVTLGGMAFAAPTTTGLLAGAAQITPLAPTHGGYTVAVPPASAALLTVPPDSPPAGEHLFLPAARRR
jgi:hypothetical protein